MPLPGYPKPTGTYILDTDASLYSVGAVLSQEQDGKEVPLAFTSNVLSESQCKYCTTKKELLAIVIYTKRFRHYLFGGDFKIRTDHAALKWLLNFREADGLMGRWLSHLSELGVTNDTIIHRRGSKHVNADALSRRPVRKCHRADCPKCTDAPEEAVPVASVTCEEFEPDIAQAQHDDRGLRTIIQRIKDRKGKPEWPQLSAESIETRKILSWWSQLTVEDEVLCRRYQPPGKRKPILQIIAPPSTRARILEQTHGDILARRGP